MAVSADGNLLVNGSFDDPEDSLKGWKYKYDLPGESWYFKNHERVSVKSMENGRKNVLRLYGTKDVVVDTGYGVKVDSQPVPFEHGSSYRFSAYARSTGPNARIYIIGYKWKSGIKPHENPELHELQEVYKQGAGNIMYFGSAKDGTVSNPRRTWQKGVCTFPGKNLSELAMKHLKMIKFISVHIVAVLGDEGELFVDDVALEKIK